MFARILRVAITIGFMSAVSAQAPDMTMFHFPRWSPDGNWLVFTTNVEGGSDEEIWIVAADGSSRRRLTDNNLTDTAADWHDAKTIVFRRLTQRGYETMLMEADGSNVRPFVAKPGEAFPFVEERRTGDGQAVFFVEGIGRALRLNAVRWAEQAALSPDRSMVAFEQRDDPSDILESDIALWDVKARTFKIVARGTDPSWSPDSRSLVFKTPVGDKPHIMLLDVASGKTRTLVAGVHPHFSPDRRSIAFMGDGPRMDIYVIRTDGTGQSCLTCSWK